MSGSELAGLAADARRPRATEVEQHGIDTIPAASTATPSPFDLFRIQFGGANTFATVILGHLPDPARAVAVAGGRRDRASVSSWAR